MEKKHVIFTLPGLGFDHRIFDNLYLPENEINHLQWIEPLPKESIGSFAKRMSENIHHDPQNCVLIGHSFGGIMAQEIAAFFPVKKIILISSIKSEKEKPLNFRLAAKLGFHHLFTKKITLNTFDYWGKNFGYETKELQQLFKDMIAGQSDQYLQWALQALSKWQGAGESKTPIHHIHGSLDKTFPIKLIGQPVLRVEGGSHMMVYNKGQIVSNMIREIITKATP